MNVEWDLYAEPDKEKRLREKRNKRGPMKRMKIEVQREKRREKLNELVNTLLRDWR